MLGNLLHEKPDELAADMRQVYGLDYRDWESDPFYYAALAHQLPPESRCMGGVGTVHMLLVCIERGIRHLAWMQSTDGQKRRNVPKPIDLFGRETESRYTEGKQSMTVEEFEALIASKRGEADG